MLRSPPFCGTLISSTVMKRFFQALAGLVILWVLGSFLGVMLDPVRANLWTKSLMWGLLSSIVLAPVFIFLGTSSSDSSSQPTAASRSQQSFEVDENVNIGSQEESGEERPRS